MISYQDKTWCSTKCGNLNCDRNFTPEHRKKAIEWWKQSSGKEEIDFLPLMVADFRTDDCGFIEYHGFIER